MEDIKTCCFKERLATRSDSLIMLSATPHDGRAESFASLTQMIEPTDRASESDYSKSEIRDLYVRRFKKDVKDQLVKHFSRTKCDRH